MGMPFTDSDYLYIYILAKEVGHWLEEKSIC